MSQVATLLRGMMWMVRILAVLLLIWVAAVMYFQVNNEEEIHGRQWCVGFARDNAALRPIYAVLTGIMIIDMVSNITVLVRLTSLLAYQPIAFTRFSICKVV
mmetsp:Transcript_36963/g.59262  ORF Transcript_36963/g.59262 Transcript_36963/m.59262 type:complete len:102 (+) Transcript_36963:900-1205(+)